VLQAGSSNSRRGYSLAAISFLQKILGETKEVTSSLVRGMEANGSRTNQLLLAQHSSDRSLSRVRLSPATVSRRAVGGVVAAI
jgi:hypothetical protein